MLVSAWFVLNKNENVMAYCFSAGIVAAIAWFRAFNNSYATLKTTLKNIAWAMYLVGCTCMRMGHKMLISLQPGIVLNALSNMVALYAWLVFISSICINNADLLEFETATWFGKQLSPRIQHTWKTVLEFQFTVPSKKLVLSFSCGVWIYSTSTCLLNASQNATIWRYCQQALYRINNNKKNCTLERHGYIAGATAYQRSWLLCVACLLGQESSLSGMKPLVGSRMSLSTANLRFRHKIPCAMVRLLFHCLVEGSIDSSLYIKSEKARSIPIDFEKM